MISHQAEYGADHLDIEEVRARIEKALAITFVAHDSSFWNGLYYLWEDDGGQSIRVADNREGEPEGILYPMHLSAVTVVLTHTVEPSTWIRDDLASVGALRLLRSTRYDSSAPKLGYETYGSPSLDPGPLRDRVGALLGITFVPLVEEAFEGECYQADGAGRESIDIFDNRDEDPDVRFDPGRPDLKSIMTVNRTARPTELRALLLGVEGLVHLSHTEH